MDQTNKNLDLQKDEKLADFADQVMKGSTKQNASPPTDELFNLEETILRLNSSFPPSSLDDATVKQMHVRLKARMRREEQKAKPSFWRKWFGREFSPQLGLAFAALAVLIVVLVSTPFQTLSGSPVTGTASSPVNFYVIAGLAGVFFMIYLFSRRK
ncbi:MAG: hypothetical protein U0V02_02135 [Anaerolineales bacterium]